jgi:hypothetical protein
MTPLAKVLKEHPTLTLQGFDSPMRPGFDADRANLSAAQDQFDRALAWLKMLPRRKVVNDRIGGSYHLKHICEGAMGNYVANGALIAAALALGLPVKATGVYALLGVGSIDRWPPGAHPKHSRIYG